MDEEQQRNDEAEMVALAKSLLIEWMQGPGHRAQAAQVLFGAMIYGHRELEFELAKWIMKSRPDYESAEHDDEWLRLRVAGVR